MRKRLLFVISQFYKGGAEVSLLNLLKNIDESKYSIDLMIMNQVPVIGAVNLIDEVPDSINVIDVYKETQKVNYIHRIQKKLLCSSKELQSYPLIALLYVRKNKYDWAFHIGEWWLPEFVATKVEAKYKAAWLHTDISLANSFRGEEFFKFDNYFDKYIFVSQKSLEVSTEKYQFLRKKGICIYNISDIVKIRRLSNQKIENINDFGKLPVVLTCANLRQEKNHLRQLEAMHILQERKIDFIWINIGSVADEELTNKLLKQVATYGLEKRFLILGPQKNPYQYMKLADIVAVLSDYESWSMVITEAKVLGKPIVATRTSGALEQIQDMQTGVLTDFTAIDIADKIQMLLQSKNLQNRIENNLVGFDNTNHIIKDFYSLVGDSDDSTSRKILYVVDDINYLSGAHIATKNQIQSLVNRKNIDIMIFSSSLPDLKTRNEFANVNFISWQQCLADRLYHRRLLDCLLDNRIDIKYKKLKMKMTWEGKIKHNPQVFDRLVRPQLSEMFSKFDIICVMSEGSQFRNAVAEAKVQRKIQYIHTDYAAWKNISQWTQTITLNDNEIYKEFDKIVLLSDAIRNRFIQLYPNLSDKTVVNKNIMPVQEIRDKAKNIVPQGPLLKFVTIGRMDQYKGYDHIYKCLNRLYHQGYQFRWSIIGDGEEFDNIKRMFQQSEFSKWIDFRGALINPFPIVKQADVFALFSRYEGLPNTIYEALIIGTPVVATNVGGIASQIEEGVNGWIVEEDDEKIYQGLLHIYTHPEEIKQYKENLKNYRYDNELIYQQTDRILFEE